LIKGVLDNFLKDIRLGGGGGGGCAGVFLGANLGFSPFCLCVQTNQLFIFLSLLSKI